MGKWNVLALVELMEGKTNVVKHAGAAPTVAACFRETHRKNRRRLLKTPWEECEPLRLLWRYCPGCSRFSVWEYFTDGVCGPDGKERIFGICWECEQFHERWRKTYLLGILYNPIHSPEKVLYDTERYRELAGDEIIDVGYRPEREPDRTLHYAQVKRVGDAQRRAAGADGAE